MSKTLTQAEYSIVHTETIGVLRFSPVHDAALQSVSPVQGKYILDLGCGNGELLSLVIAAGGVAYGIDYEPASIEQAKAIAGAHIHQGSIAEAFPYDSSFFNGIVSLGTVGYLSKGDMQKTFAECHRVLIAGGKIVIRTPSAINYIGMLILKCVKGNYQTNTHFYPLSFYTRSLNQAQFAITHMHRSLDEKPDAKISPLRGFVRKALFPFLAPVWIEAIKE